MPRPVVCPHCGEELDIPAELRTREVRCAVCRNTFLPAAADVVVDPADTPPPAPDRRTARDVFDDAEPRPRPRPRAGCSWAWVLVIGGLGCCGLSCGGLFLFGLYIAFPDFQPYHSKEGRFHADFPGQPREVEDTDENLLKRHNVEFRRKFPPESYFVRYVDLPAAALKPGADVVLDTAADKVVQKLPGSKEVGRSERKTVGGYPAVDVTVRHPDTSVTVARVVLADKRLYVAGMTGGGLNWDTPHVQHFMEAFRITPADDADEPAAKQRDEKPRPPAKKQG